MLVDLLEVKYKQGKYNQGLILAILVINHSLKAEGVTHCFLQPIASQFASQYIKELVWKNLAYLHSTNSSCNQIMHPLCCKNTRACIGLRVSIFKVDQYISLVLKFTCLLKP